MQITSLTFLFFFLPLVTVIHYYVKGRKKNLVLLLFNILFYIWGNPFNIIFILISSLTNFFITKLLFEDDNLKKSSKKIIFTLAIILNVLFLGVFKYYGFFVNTINSIASVNIATPKLPFPLGISFFVFQSISFLSDVYTKKIKASPSFLNYIVYITMFPTITAGPIVRYIDIERDMNNRQVRKSDISVGITKIIIGLSKKILIANNIYELWLASSKIELAQITVLQSWLMAFAYALYIYFDFSGYSDMALGFARLLGFRLKENFDYPYTSTSVSEFFRRWHISLGSWFKDCIYIPLGGSREGSLKTIINILIVWAATGLWHGPSWTFVLWGIYLGLIIIIEKLVFSKISFRLTNFIKYIYTLFLILIGWVLFYSSSLFEVTYRIKTMFFLNTNEIYNDEFFYYFFSYIIIIALGVLFSTKLPKEFLEEIQINQKRLYNISAPLILTILFILSVAYLLSASHTPFLYANF